VRISKANSSIFDAAARLANPCLYKICLSKRFGNLMQEPGLSIKRELPFVREMFDRIAPQYDFLNRLLSLRRDVFWRQALLESLNLTPGARVLDAACGTADVALAIVRYAPQGVRIVGADFSLAMLALARQKSNATGCQDAICLAAADVLHAPFGPEKFDVVTMAFGIRNIQNKSAALKGLYTLIKPGGRLAILELVTPPKGLLRQAYLIYFNRFLPLIGRFFSRHNYAYTYLPNSVSHFPSPEEFARQMKNAGFVSVRFKPMTLGIAVLFIGDKPSSFPNS
jgi:demethylmenaquinone methyltransferase/2-methoxy-6-polyprenyl-1,4-benzoquinol methylase